MPQRNVVLITTLGHRDILVDGDRLPPNAFRSTCQKLLEAVDRDQDIWQRVTFPLLDPLLRWIASPASSGSRPALHLYAYLVATDQREARFRETDTAPLAELVTRWLEKVRPERFGGLSARSRLFTGNPAAFDETLRHFRSLATRKVLPQRLEAPEFLVHVTSGTPALVFGVLLGLAPILPPETRVVVMPPESTRPLPFELLRALGRLQASRDASLALAHWAPELAATLLERSNAPDSLVEAVRAFRDRLSFDFRRALARLEQQVLPSASSELRRWATAQRDEVASLAEAVDALRRTSPAPRLVQLLLYELWQGTRIAGEQSRSLEFLARLFRLEEALLRWTVEQWLALPTGATRDEQGRSRSLPEYRRALDRGGPLHELAERFRIDPERPPDRHTVRLLLAEGPAAHEDAVRRVVAVSRKVASLSDLRNDSVVGHGFTGVSPEILRATLTDVDSTPERLLEELASVIGCDEETPPLVRSCAELRALVERWGIESE